MSIDENKGGFYRTLKELRETNGQSSNKIFLRQWGLNIDI